MQVNFVTLFPEIIQQMFDFSIMKRAVESGKVNLGLSNPRDYATDKHRTVDDKPFGGGPGMLMKAPVVASAIQALNMPSGSACIFTDPTGYSFDQRTAVELSKFEEITFVCGHYEGIDDRVRIKFATHVFSIGDYVLTGGELPALVMADTIIRLLPGVLGDDMSLEIDAHAGGLLSAPQYTRPERWEGMEVDPVFRSGDHKKLELHKRRIALELTRDRRPDLFCRAKLEKSDLNLLSS